MSLQWQLSRDVPPDTAALGQTIFAAHNVYRQIGERFDQLFPDEQVFASLYDTQGRGAISPLLLSLVTVFQMLEKVPDRTAAEFVAARLDWKYALHLPLAYPGFHFTDLYAFRGRLLEHGQERFVFEQLLMRLKEMGLLKPKGKMRTDSTHVLGVVERLSQLELICESLRLALQAVTQAVPDWVARQLPAIFSETYAQRQSEYGLSDIQVKERLVKAGRDAFWFLAQVDRSTPQSVRHLPEVEILRQVLAQQFPSGPGHPPTSQRPSGKAVIESPHDPEVRFAQKRGQGWLGYKAQVTESCDPAQPHLIVDLEPTGALDNDSPELPKVQARLQAQGILPAEQYVDQGYMSAAHLANSADLGLNLMGVPLDDTQAAPGFRQADFHIATQAQQATCPAGQNSQVWAENANGQIKIRFAGKTCRACPYFGVCTSSQQGRSLTLSPHRAILGLRRAQAKTETFQAKMRLRAGIEATISELVRRYQFRQARYRGLAKLRLQAYFTAVAINLNRLARWWAQPVNGI